jgi:hypothetical protein
MFNLTGLAFRWVNGMTTWPYQRVLVKESSDEPTGRINYPDGFVSRDREWLHLLR